MTNNFSASLLSSRNPTSLTLVCSVLSFTFSLAQWDALYPRGGLLGGNYLIIIQ